MLANADYLELDALDLARGIRRQQFSTEDVMGCAIERARQVNPLLNAIVFANDAEAMARAQAVDQDPASLDRSPLAGLPILIKDLSDVSGLPSTYGSRLYRDYIPQGNSRIVQKYLDAGLIVLGKTNTPEKGLVITTEPVATGPTRNPWNTDYSAGGSSGGAAAAVAAGIVPVAHATDGGGSIRIPAACCGLVGLKPSRGLTAIEPRLADCWSGMSVGHVVSRTVRDSAAFLDLILLDRPGLFPRPQAPTSFYADHQQEPGVLRIALQTAHPQEEAVDGACLEAVHNAAALCESLGHSVEEVTHPLDYTPLIKAMAQIINLHVYQGISPRLEQLGLSLEEAPLEAATRLMAKLGREVLASDYVAARDLLHAAAQTMAEFHQGYDVILSPVLAKTPARLGWLDMNSADLKEYSSRFRQYSGFTALYNGTGQPSLSLPLHRADAGLPVGVMFTAAWGNDSLLLRLARQLEQARPWPRRAPEPAAAVAIA